VSAKVSNFTAAVIEGYQIFPAQEPLPDVRDASVPSFQIDDAIYQSDAYFPSEIVQIEEAGIIRGCSVAILRVFPVQFNPVKKTLRVHSRIRVNISFGTPTATISMMPSERVLFSLFTEAMVPPGGGWSHIFTPLMFRNWPMGISSRFYGASTVKPDGSTMKQTIQAPAPHTAASISRRPGAGRVAVIKASPVDAT
jgi:hypothetical protein